jgi:hypothetical protein
MDPQPPAFHGAVPGDWGGVVVAEEVCDQEPQAVVLVHLGRAAVWAELDSPPAPRHCYAPITWTDAAQPAPPT